MSLGLGYSVPISKMERLAPSGELGVWGGITHVNTGANLMAGINGTVGLLAKYLLYLLALADN